MTRIIRLIARLYPARWRQRYEREFDALLDDVAPSWRVAGDILMGAIIVQLKSLTTLTVLLPVTLAAAGAGLGVVWSMRAPALYESSATVRVAIPRNADISVVRSTFERTGVPPARVAVVLEHENKDALEGTSVLRVSTVDQNAAAAQRSTQTLIDGLRTSLAGRDTAAQAAPTVETLRWPTLPTSSTRRGQSALAGSGGVMGLVLGSVAAWLSRRRRA